MSKTKNGGLDQYGAGPFEQQQFGTAGVEGVNAFEQCCLLLSSTIIAIVLQVQGDGGLDNSIGSKMCKVISVCSTLNTDLASSVDDYVR